MLIQSQGGGLPSTAVTSGTPANPGGQRGEAIVSEMRGKYANAALAGFLFTVSVAAVTVPVNANNLVSTFSLNNPQNSQKTVELVSFSAGTVLATTVVDLLGLYFQSGLGSTTAILSSQTAIASKNCLLGGTVNSQATGLSAGTHTGTPSLLVPLYDWGAVTQTNFNPTPIVFDGVYMMPPATVVSAAMSTAASTGSGVTEAITWAEW